MEVRRKMKKINILQVCNQLGIGGTERALQTFTEYLNKDIFETYVCGIFEGGVRERKLREEGFETYVVQGDRKKFFQLLRDKKIDVVHVHRSGVSEGFVIETAKEAGVPVIVETNIFGLYDSSEAEKMIDVHLQVSRTSGLKYIKNAGISMHEFLNKCRVLYYPIDLKLFEKYKPLENQIWQFRSEIGVDKNTPLICRVGRPDPAKMDDFLVRMMSHLIKRVPDVKFLVVGGIPEKVKKKIEKLKLQRSFIDIGLVASEEKLIQIYYSIDILAHSSRIGESFGYTIAEAMAAGKPVVVNSTPWADNAQIELVDNGKTGFVANTPRTYADAVAYLIENKKEAEKMGLAGREKVEREYDVKKLVKMLEKIYLELLSKKGYTHVEKYLLKEYKNVQYFPTDYDILNYPEEYKKRLGSSFGKLSLIEKIDFKLRHYARYRSLVSRIN